MTKLNWNKAKRYKEYIPLKPDRDISRYHDQKLTRYTKASRKQCREMVEQGIGSIHATQDKIDRRLLRGAYGKQALLETIYTVYVGWRDGGDADGIRRDLVRRLADGTISADAHLLELLIRVALPDVELNVVRMWVEAIRYGEGHHIRPSKLRGFLWVKGGLVRCAELYRQEQEERRKAEKRRARQAERDRQEHGDRMKDARRARLQARRREKQLRAIPEGKWGLYD